MGFELARLFAKDGYNLVFVCRSSERVDKVAQELRNEFQIDVKTISQDLFIHGAAKVIYEKTKQSGVTINILVNCAGQAQYGPFANSDLERQINLVYLNIVALMSLTSYYLKEMLSQNEGKVLNFSSSLSKSPAPFLATYGSQQGVCAVIY